MSIFNEISFAFKGFSFEEDSSNPSNGHFIFQGTRGLTPSQYANVRRVEKYLNHSQPACRLYQDTLGDLGRANRIPVKKIEIKMVPHKEADTGGACYGHKNLIVVSVNETTIDEKTKLPLALAETVLFELANLSHYSEFQTLKDKVKNQEIRTGEEYAERVEREEFKSQSIAEKAILESIDEAPSEEESDFWSHMARRFSEYRCGLLIRSHERENPDALVKETENIWDGKRKSFTPEELENIALEVQLHSGHTQCYYDFFNFASFMRNKT